MKLHKALSIAAYGGSILTLLFALAGCATLDTPQTENPGVYGLKGWNYSSVWSSPTENTVEAADINGEVGHPLTVEGPRMRVSPSGNWTGNKSVVSGSLPPGLTMDNYGQIKGIPTERGHWIVKVELGTVTAVGQTWLGFTQELRFHITGSGKVND
ncbi:MAG: hypothetical protein AABO58_05405 [Acidobacteriota bacterium]